MSTMTLQEPETIDDYHADYSADSHSSLQLFRASREAYYGIRIARTMKPQPATAAMEFGSLFHAIMEGVFAERYAIAPICDRRTKAGKQVYDEFTSANCEKIIVSHDDYQQAMAMREGVMRNPDAAAMVERQGEVEKRYDFILQGMPVKMRADKVIDYGGTILVIDFKTTDDISPDGFGRTCHNFGYHRQQAMYQDIVSGAIDAEVLFAFVAVSKKEPYETACHCLDDNAVALGQRENWQTLEEIKRCHATGDWSGRYSRGINKASLPRWAYGDIR